MHFVGVVEVRCCGSPTYLAGLPQWVGLQSGFNCQFGLAGVYYSWKSHFEKLKTNMDQYLNSIKQYIADDELSIAIEMLNELLLESPKLDELIMQSARYADVRKQIRLGILGFSKASTAKNQIRISLLELVNEINRLQVKNINIISKSNSDGDVKNIEQLKGKGKIIIEYPPKLNPLLNLIGYDIYINNKNFGSLLAGNSFERTIDAGTHSIQMKSIGAAKTNLIVAEILSGQTKHFKLVIPLIAGYPKLVEVDS